MRFLTSLMYLASVALRLAVIIVPPLLMRPMLGSSLAMSFFVPLVWITVTLVVLFFREIRNMTPQGDQYANVASKEQADINLDSWRSGRPFADDWNSSIKDKRNF